MGNETILWNKVMKEVKLKRFVGPFTSPPFKYYIQSPIGLVPKSNGDVRLIFHLSYPRGATKRSVNSCIPEHLCKVKYPDFCEAIKRCTEEGMGCFISKTDMASAFRVLGMSEQRWPWLVLKARSPIDKKWYYFFDKCLSFGSLISCAHFQSVSDGIAHIQKWRTGKIPINYLDDFFFAALLKMLCDQQLQVFLDICKEICFPVALEKTFWGVTRLIFLGLLIDTELQIIAIPRDKVMRALEMLKMVRNNKKSHSISSPKALRFLKLSVQGHRSRENLYNQIIQQTHGKY